MTQDLIFNCAECGTPFVWTIAEQASGDRPALCPACRRLSPLSGRRRGVVKWFNRAKGYGFITPLAGPELFVHKSGLATGQPLPHPGQLVEFVVVSTPRGAQAEAVVILEPPPDQGETGD